jgi:predicted Rossmann fold nucleotide-binding protein DprA/Smf involved in DNA uptake
MSEFASYFSKKTDRLQTYQHENVKLQEKISQHGAIQLLKQTDRETFPRRNRVITGVFRTTLAYGSGT